MAAEAEIGARLGSLIGQAEANINKQTGQRDGSSPLRASATGPPLAQEAQGAQKVVGESQVGREAERGQVLVRRREYEAEVADFLKEAAARAQVETDAADEAQRLELLAVEHPPRDLARQAASGCVGPPPTQPAFGQRRARQTRSQAQAEEQHPLDVRGARESEGELPVEARARAHNLGHVADPGE